MIPTTVPAATKAAARAAQASGCVLVADGCCLILVEPWLSLLDPEMRDRLAADVGAVIAMLRHGR